MEKIPRIVVLSMINFDTTNKFSDKHLPIQVFDIDFLTATSLGLKLNRETLPLI